MADSHLSISRRAFLAESTAATAALLTAPLVFAAESEAPAFLSDWANSPDRVWPGPEYWTNPLQDWRIANGRLECIKGAQGRTVHLLTRELAVRAGTLLMSVRIGRVEGGAISAGKGGAGFSVGVRGPLNEYRNNLVHGSGFNVGLRAKGELFIGDGPNGKSAAITLSAAAVELRLRAEPAGDGYRVHLAAHSVEDGKLLGEVERVDVPAEFFVGNLALAANFGQPAGQRPNQPAGRAVAGADQWWFADWRISGTKVTAHPDRTFGPLLFNQYTLHEGILKMSVQMPPLGSDDAQTVKLQVAKGNGWETIGEATIEAVSRIAHFVVRDWKSTADVRYRVAYGEKRKNGGSREHLLEGTIRKDPRENDVLTVADISCNAHFAFPNVECASAVAKLNPDLLAFTGDQYYESTAGFGVDRSSVENSVLDVLRKWMLHGWTWRDLMRDRPTISIPDDHDVYHGNLWGEGGAAAPAATSPAEAKGGYKMTADFVNAVHRMQTAHHPDSPAQPGKQGITGYYGPLTYGGISFAVLADRQYKSGPDGKVPPTSGRADHVNDPNFDPMTADLPGLELLGDPQMQFLKQWVTEWKGAEMKAVISQTLFTAMATHHGKKDGLLVADYDTNAWPQAARNAAVKEMRRAFAFHLAGDQHLPAVVHYGVDEHRDGVVAFASPAVNNLYPRWFLPAGTDQTTGNFRDSFGHPMTVLACANPKTEFRKPVLEAEMDRSSGYGVVRFDKKARTITIECWPLLADPLRPGTQFPGWPVKVTQLANYARAAKAHLPTVRIAGATRPVLQVTNEADGELVYVLRLSGSEWQPPVFAEGLYTVRVSDPETGRTTEAKGVRASKENAGSMDMKLGA
jgi:alkaline phosphatase D